VYSEVDEEIEVETIEIDGSVYYKTEEGVLLDRMSHDIVGLYVNGKIESINN